MLAGTKYWLREWMDAHGINDLAAAEQALQDTRRRADLFERARGGDDTTAPIVGDSETTVLAGRVIDLSGELDVYAWDFLKRRVDELFSRVWHYFDRIVVVGVQAQYFTHEWHEPGELNRRILLYVRLILYLRSIGAEGMLLFRRKPHVDEEELDASNAPAPLLTPEAERDFLIRLTAFDRIVHLRPHGNHFHYQYNWERLDHSVWGAAWGELEKLTQEQVAERVAQCVLRRFAAHLESDVSASRQLGCALGVTLPFHCDIAELVAPASPSASQVAFDLDLPVLSGVHPADLLALRRDEHDAFVAFRAALRRAMTERLDAAEHRSTHDVAREIQRDVIEPAIGEIRRRLAAAERALARKASLRIALGGLATSCGLIAGIPLLTATGVGTVLTALGPLDTFSDERKQVAVSEMYFAWRAATRPPSV